MKNVRTRSSQTKGSLVTTDKDVQLTSAGSLRDHPSFFFFFTGTSIPGSINLEKHKIYRNNPSSLTLSKITVQSPRPALFMSAPNRHNIERAPKARKEQILSEV